MDTFLRVIQIIFTIFFWISASFTLYYAFLYIVGLIAHKIKYPMVEDKEKFCIFVPCHNEGEVVAATVENYSHFEYNPNLYDIFFIADNCTDNTAEVLRAAVKKYGMSNFHVLERTNAPADKRGKPHALRWGIETLEKDNAFYNKYDMFMVFDADNFADADILKHINSQYLSYKPDRRPTMLQTYLDSKNNKGLIAKGYFASYRVTCSFWQVAKHKLHLTPAIGGTGFAMETSFLKEIGGFNCKSLTEDLEISMLCTIKNRKIVFNSNARIYDEKPTRLKQSLVQRTRWAQGHFYVAFKFVPILFIQLFNPKTIRNFFRKLDALIYLLVRLFCIISTLVLLFGFAWFIHLCYFAATISTNLGDWLYYMIINQAGIPNGQFDLTGSVFTGYVNPWIGPVILVCAALTFIVVPLASLYDGTKEEKKRILIDLIPNAISFYVVGLFDLITSWPGLFKCGNQKVWKKTQHNLSQLTRVDSK